MTVNRFEAARRHALEPPYVLKPVNEGSSLGVIIVREDRARIRRRKSGREDWPYGDMLLAEQFIAGKELTCAVDGRPGRSASSKSSRFPKRSTIMTQNMQKAARSTSFRQILNQIFTIRSKS